MIKYISILLISILAISCSLQSRLDKYCPLCPEKVVFKDSIRIEKDSTGRVDTIYKLSPGDSAKLQAYADCINGKAQMAQTSIGNGKASVKVGIKNGIVSATAYCAADSLMTLLIYSRVYIKTYKATMASLTPRPVIIKQRPHPFFYWWFGGSVALLFIAFVLKLRSAIISDLKKRLIEG